MTLQLKQSCRCQPAAKKSQKVNFHEHLVYVTFLTDWAINLVVTSVLLEKSLIRADLNRHNNYCNFAVKESDL